MQEAAQTEEGDEWDAGGGGEEEQGVQSQTGAEGTLEERDGGKEGAGAGAGAEDDNNGADEEGEEEGADREEAEEENQEEEDQDEEEEEEEEEEESAGMTHNSVEKPLGRTEIRSFSWSGLRRRKLITVECGANTGGRLPCMKSHLASGEWSTSSGIVRCRINSKTALSGKIETNTRKK